MLSQLSKYVKARSILQLKIERFTCFSIESTKKYSKLRRRTEEDVIVGISKSLAEYKDIQFEPFRIKAFTLGSSVTNANVKIEQIITDINVETIEPDTVDDSTEAFSKIINLNSIYRNGFNALEQHVTDGKMTDNVDVNFVIQAMKAGFLQDLDFHERCLQKIFVNEDDEDDDVNEELYEIVIMANHLFSRLTMPRISNSARFGSHFSVLNDDRSRNIHRMCPCDMCKEKIPYHNSGIGSEMLFYGYPDIIVYSLGGKCNIIQPQQEDRNYWLTRDDHAFEAEFDEKQLIELKKQKELLRSSQNISQFVAQCITFSFYQKHYQLKHRKDSLPVSLIPTIALSGMHFDIYMYDIDNDILLRNKGDPIPLWRRYRYPEAKLDMSAIIQIWMVLNHITLNPSLPQEDIQSLKGSCDFLHQLQHERIDLIEKTVTMKKTFTPWQYEEINTIPFPEEKCISI
ncbi:uncharacterized protein LOC127735501 isoform X2 [Mytilus californianus]|uniref:uncharacterized protein LOC127735501 isoform X1 n=1 Tax=Mytilus californianus TaxID=6549 RepID=UPI002245B0EF|nr:uncharacterized protein LOC127735501 isoform X1 [Mytilus californianus]XP_052101642.1 uncharacterized protein LOC127735501 isoform X2 [Mytilus californianus]